MRMRAALAREIGQLTIEEVELDPPRADEVLVRMRATGVCHSDLHTYKGELRAMPPLVLGHEGAGIIVQVGDSVTRVKPGDRVLINWIPACETCPTCLSGRYNLCERLSSTTFQALLPDGTTRLKTLDGLPLKHYLSVATMAEHAVVHEASAIPFPADVPFEVAAVIGCAVATGVGAVTNTAQAKAGRPAAVLGCGGVGLSAIQGCKLVGCSPIVAVDLMDSKLAFARQLGATHTVNAQETDPVEAMRSLTGGGPEYVFDSVGSEVTIAQALYAARPGGTAVVMGLHAVRGQVPISPLALVLQNKRLLGSFVGSMNPRLDLPMLVELYRAGKLELDKLITKRYALDDLPQAFEDMEAGKIARGVLVFEETNREAAPI
jgi:S-(hydroxymethyl)glutathione dehydrogenase/alcohol dehydrogenase